MATTTFTNNVTLTDAGWFNDVDAVVYDGGTDKILVGGGAGSVAVMTTATGTGAPVRAGAPTFTGAITEAARAAAYQWTAWDPSDISGAATNAPATAAASLTATNYMTMANSSGTVTFTFTKAGNYLIMLSMQNEGANTLAAGDSISLWATIGGSATRYLQDTTLILGKWGTGSGIGAQINGASSGTATCLVSATANQTLTVLPVVEVVCTTGSATASQFTTTANATAAYMGTT